MVFGFLGENGNLKIEYYQQNWFLAKQFTNTPIFTLLGGSP